MPPIQKFIFPYLGGRWTGYVQFEGKEGTQRLNVKLEIKHTLFGLRLLLDSKESTSWTLLVHAERNRDFERYRLYYVYLNERKEGFANGGERYRGLAVMRIEPGARLKLQGDSFPRRAPPSNPSDRAANVGSFGSPTPREHRHRMIQQQPPPQPHDQQHREGDRRALVVNDIGHRADILRAWVDGEGRM
jgi:hypothetical protein